MTGIGGINCTLFSATQNRTKETTEIWRVPGYDGYGIHKQGMADSEYQARGILFDTNNDVEAWYAALCVLQGDIVTWVNDWGDTGFQSLVKRVGPLKKQSSLHGPGVVRGEVTFTLMTVRNE